MKNIPIITRDDMARCNLTFEPAAAIIAPLTGYGCADFFRLIASQQPPGFSLESLKTTTVQPNGCLRGVTQ
jgi:hypothetical protein